MAAADLREHRAVQHSKPMDVSLWGGPLFGVQPERPQAATTGLQARFENHGLEDHMRTRWSTWLITGNSILASVMLAWFVQRMQ